MHSLNDGNEKASITVIQGDDIEYGVSLVDDYPPCGVDPGLYGNTRVRLQGAETRSGNQNYSVWNHGVRWRFVGKR